MNAVLHEPALIDMLLREPAAADVRCADPDAASQLLPRLIGISLAGLGAFAVVQGALVAAPGPWPGAGAPADTPRAIAVVFCAYAGGLFGAQIAGLPSAWFYALLAGLRASTWRIAVEAMRAQATAATVLLGLLPVYLAAGLGIRLVDAPELLEALVIGLIGYTLPFVAGLAGTIGMYGAFSRMVAEARARGEATNTAVPLLLVFAWSVLFTAMAPLGVWRILTTMGG